MTSDDVTAPLGGKISLAGEKLNVPDYPVIPFIRGDGTGKDIWAAAERVLNAAVKKAYQGAKKIVWLEVFAGEAAKEKFDNWLPDETIAAFKKYRVGIKGPLTTPVSGGFRSLNVALRQQLDLYVCQRPVQYFDGVPSPVKHPEKVDIVIFRENTEDIYAGIEYRGGTPESQAVLDFLQRNFPKQFAKVRFGTQEQVNEYMRQTSSGHGAPPVEVGIGIKPVSAVGTIRLVKAAIDYAIAHNRKSVTIVHKGNIMKFTEGAFKDWGYALAAREFGATPLDGGPWYELTNPCTGRRIVVKDRIADAMLQQILTRPDEYDVIATMNLNGDYLSDALAAQVGGIGIAPGGNINYLTGHAIFEATHGTAPKYAGLDKVNPGSLILSGEMMLRYLGWNKAADLVIKGLRAAIRSQQVTYDFARLMENAVEVKCSQFGDNVISLM